MLATSVLLLPFVIKGAQISRLPGVGFLAAYLGSNMYFVYTPRNGAAASTIEATGMLVK